MARTAAVGQTRGVDTVLLPKQSGGRSLSQPPKPVNEAFLLGASRPLIDFVVHSERLIDSTMPPFTALLHTANAALTLGRALETLLPCSEVLIVDHQSTDATVRIAREYGARIVPIDSRFREKHYVGEALHDWILCLDPSESITEGLQVTLFEWNSLPAFDAGGARSFSVSVREQTARDWRIQPTAETRLVPRDWTLWSGLLPTYDPLSIALEGELIRLNYP